MKRNCVLGWVTSTVILLVFASALAAPPPLPPRKVIVSPETTVLTEPLNADGTVNYVAAVNRMLAKQVPLEENGYAIFVNAMGEKSWPDPETRRRTHELLGTPVPDEAAALSRLIMSLKEWTPEETERDARRHHAIERAWQRNEFPDIAAWLEANEAAMKIFEQASRQPKWFVPLVDHDDPPSLSTSFLPHLGLLREVAKAHAARANLRAAAGDYDGAWADIMTINRMSRLIAQERMMISRLVAISLQAIARQSTQVLINEPLDADRALRSARDLQALPPLPPIREMIDRGERLCLLDALQHAMRQRKAPLEMMWDGNAQGAQMTMALLQTRAVAPNEILRGINRHVDEFLHGCDSGTYDAAVRLDQTWDEKASAVEKTLVANADFIALVEHGHTPAAGVSLTEPATDFLAVSFLRGWLAIDKTQRTAKAFEASGVASLRAAAFRARHGRLPASLAELDAPPPLDPFTDQPLSYRVHDGGAEIYSVGPDREDQGGHDPEDPFRDPGMRMKQAATRE